jgi:regulator of replication initiation timing
MHELRDTQSESGELIERVHRLRVILPAMAQETADARREAARLRVENAKLQRRIAELERSSACVTPPEAA